MYKVYNTTRFDKELSKLSLEEQKRIQSIYTQLRDNPYVGDQLRYKFLREKRLKEKRIYYLIYDDLKAVLIVAISDKKTQQDTINHIVDFFEEYKVYVNKLVNKN